MKLEPICTHVPGHQPIELVAYYPQFASYYPGCEMATKQWFVRHAGRDWTYLDCGANIGYYSILFSRLSPEGSIYAFEPTTTMDMLEANLKHHGVGNVHPVRMALGKTSGEINDKIFRIWSKEPEEDVYPFVTIDDFVAGMKLGKLDCIKIDVDSFDFEVLQGAEKTLRKMNPYVMVELNHALVKRHQSAVQALEWLASIGYETATFFEYENCLLKRGGSNHVPLSHRIKLCFASEGSALSAPPPQDIEAEIGKGEKLFLEGRVNEALDFFARLASREPGDQRVFNNLGVITYHLGDAGKALFYFNKGRVLAPDNEELVFNQASVLAALGQNAKALAVCRELSNRRASGRVAQLANMISRQQKAGVPTADVLLAPALHVDHLHKELGFATPIDYPREFLETPLEKWRMEINDSPIFRYLYRQFKPKRHLEFGTWQGAGTVYCLEECAATVWTLNLPAGELTPEGKPAYTSTESYGLGTSSGPDWARRIGLAQENWYRTDTLGFIGRFYLERDLGHRVCQIYADSTKWDDSQYPDGFFDSVLVDGGHIPEVVASDTKKALRLVRPGGLIMWHDFCPPVAELFGAPKGVQEGLGRVAGEMASTLSNLFWIKPSWILVGIRL